MGIVLDSFVGEPLKLWGQDCEDLCGDVLSSASIDDVWFHEDFLEM